MKSFTDAQDQLAKETKLAYHQEEFLEYLKGLFIAMDKKDPDSFNSEKQWEKEISGLSIYEIMDRLTVMAFSMGANDSSFDRLKRENTYRLKHNKLSFL